MLEQFGSDVEIEGVGLPSVDQVLEKSGRTTGVTRGRVEGLGTYFYPEAPGGVGGFRLIPELDDPEKQDLSAAGDSGCVYYDPRSKVGFGLHCAGEINDPANEFAIACYLSRVLLTLGVSLSPSARPAPRRPRRPR